MSDVPRFNADEYWWAYDSDINRSDNHYHYFARKHRTGIDICGLLSKDPRVKLLIGDNNLVCSGGGGMGIMHVESLAAWVLWAMHEYGADVTEIKLEEYLNAEKIPVMLTLWVLGIRLKDTINIEDGIQIIPVEKMPESREKENYTDRHRKGGDFPMMHPRPQAAIVGMSERIKVFTQKEARDRTKQGTDAYRVSEEERKHNQTIFNSISKISCLLNAVRGVSCIPYYSTVYGLPDTPMGVGGGGGGSYTSYGVSGLLGFSEINAGTVDDLNTLISQFDTMSIENQSSIYSALDRLRQAKTQGSVSNQILDLCIALEMLLRDNNDRQSAQSFSARGSWFIGTSYTHRKEVFEQLKTIYRYRSRVAHGGVLTRAEVKEIHSNLPKYIGLAEEIVRKVIYNPNVNWSDLQLGKTEPAHRD